MARCVQVLVNKPDDPSVIPRTHMVEERTSSHDVSRLADHGLYVPLPLLHAPT